MAYERTLKDAFRDMLNRRLIDLVYNIGFHCLRDVTQANMPLYEKRFHRKGPFGTKSGFNQNVHAYNTWHWVNFGAGFGYTTGTQDGKISYFYRPKKMLKGWDQVHLDQAMDPYIEFWDFTLSDIEDEEILPLQLLPQGAPSIKTYVLKNNRPKQYADEFETEDTKEKQQEKTFGWLAAQEYEETIKGQAGVSVQVEASARFQQRVEKHGDQRWLETSNHRQLLRGKHPVGPYAMLTATLTDQQTKMKQPVRIKGRLESKVRIMIDPHSTQQWDSIDKMLDTLRGFGGDGWLDKIFGRTGHAVPEDILANKIIPYIPMAFLELVPEDIKNINVSKDLSESPYPGHEDEPDGDGLYEKYKPKPGAGDDMFGGGGGFGDDDMGDQDMGDQDMGDQDGMDDTDMGDQDMGDQDMGDQDDI